MSMLARVRQRLARSPWMYWAGVGALALLAGLLVARSAAGIDHARSAWGTTRPVLVAVTDVTPGQTLAGVVERRAVPLPLVPASAVAEVEPEAVARQRVAAGEIVVATDVAATAGPQALTPDGWLAVPVAEAVVSGAASGDGVQVAAAGVVLAEGVVVGQTASAVLVAVPADDAPQVAMAAAGGEAMLLLSP